MSRAPGGNTGHPAVLHNDSSHTVMGSGCTTGPQPADTLDRSKGGLSPELSPHSLSGSSSISVPAQEKKNNIYSK